MSALLIENLPRVRELDLAARAAIRGGNANMPSIAVGEYNPNGPIPMPPMPSMPPLPSVPMPPMPKLPEFPPGFPFQPRIVRCNQCIPGHGRRPSRLTASVRRIGDVHGDADAAD
ncbi:hypothetical protein AWV79_31305 [Cupriavidus sp. UYMMa02A]|nr:hypothetical protein AWV79_31305 [Cupriavidus sp. UYMMa02A]